MVATGERQDPKTTTLGVNAAGKSGTEGFLKYVPRGPSDPATVSHHPSFVTHCRSAYMILESVGPGRREGPHSKQRCSVDARTEGGGCGR
jgi:hypothetical protein